jgi:hypothetical protein
VTDNPSDLGNYVTADNGPGGTAVGRPKKAIEDAQNAIGGVFRRKPE